MNYIKKMCILRQIRQGFSGDGKTLSGLIKIEQYGKNYPIVVYQPAGRSDYQVMIGGLNKDEYGIVLQRFRKAGFKDAFLRSTF